MIKVLFVCIQNSARSQIAEAYVRQECGDLVSATSAGIEPGELNPLAVEVMKEDGIDISLKTTKSVFDLYKSGELFHYVITVCDEASAERCPVFPGITTRLHWSFADPATFTGDRDERLELMRHVRDEIKAKIQQWCAKECGAGAR